MTNKVTFTDKPIVKYWEENPDTVGGTILKEQRQTDKLMGMLRKPPAK